MALAWLSSPVNDYVNDECVLYDNDFSRNMHVLINWKVYICLLFVQLTLTLGDHQDTQILAQVKQTAVRSKRLVEDLQHLKSKVYSIEKDFRHMHDH